MRDGENGRDEGKGREPSIFTITLANPPDAVSPQKKGNGNEVSTFS